jgi:hypothetical protein
MVSLHVQKHSNVLSVARTQQRELQAAYGEVWWAGYIADRRSEPEPELEPEPEPEELSAQQPSAADDLARLTGLPRPEAALLLEAASGDFSTAMLWHSEGRSVRQQDSTTDEYQLVVPDGVEPGQKLSTTTPTVPTPDAKPPTAASIRPLSHL